MENLIKTLLPSECIFCKRLGRMVCYACSYDCVAINKPVCMVCQEPTVDGKTHIACFKPGIPTELFSCFEYEGKVRQCIMTSKYPPHLYGSLEDLTTYGIRYALSIGYYLSGYLVVPIPLSKKKLKARGFNQATIVAKEISKQFGLKPVESILIRKLDTPTQAEFTRRERMKNMENAFVAHPDNVKNKKILLVDDIYTTGATLLSASRALLAAGAAEVKCFTLSRVH